MMSILCMSRVWREPARLVVFLGLLLNPLLLSALEVPPLTGRIVDLERALPAHDSEQLSARLEAHEQQTGNQVAVLILPSLEGEPVEEYSHRVATTWRLGRKGTDNGVLLLIALKERKLRIEVGYGLEGTLTDLRSAHIIRNEIVPRFKAGDIPAGVRAGTDAILRTIEGTYQAAESPSRERLVPDSSAFQYVVIGIFVGVLAGLVLSQGLRRARALLGAVLTFMVAQAASILWGVAAAGLTAALLWMVLSAKGPGRRRGFDDWTWYSSGRGGWSGGSFDHGGFGGGGGDFGGGGASGDW
jgi:uncharacterized protein